MSILQSNTLYPRNSVTIVNHILVQRHNTRLKQLQHLYSLQAHKRTTPTKPAQLATGILSVGGGVIRKGVVNR